VGDDQVCKNHKNRFDIDCHCFHPTMINHVSISADPFVVPMTSLFSLVFMVKTASNSTHALFPFSNFVRIFVRRSAESFSVSVLFDLLKCLEGGKQEENESSVGFVLN
jgi:hypothetical protein